jgi:hypothetical protein
MKLQGDQNVCSPDDDYSTKKTQKYFKQFQSLTIITQIQLGITDGIGCWLVAACKQPTATVHATHTKYC